MRLSISADLALVLEREFDLGAVDFDLAVVQLHVELSDLRNAQIAQRLSGACDGRPGRLLPGFRTGADEFYDLVHALAHINLPLLSGATRSFELRGSHLRPAHNTHPM